MSYLFSDIYWMARDRGSWIFQRAWMIKPKFFFILFEIDSLDNFDGLRQILWVFIEAASFAKFRWAGWFKLLRVLHNVVLYLSWRLFLQQLLPDSVGQLVRTESSIAECGRTERRFPLLLEASVVHFDFLRL